MKWWLVAAVTWFVAATVLALVAVGIAHVFGHRTLRAALRIVLTVYVATALAGIGWIVWFERSSTPGLGRAYHPFVVDRDGSGLRTIARDQRGRVFTSPSPPSSVRRSGRQRILSWSASGSRVSVRLGGLGTPGYLRWSPDRRLLLFGAYDLAHDRRFHLYTVPAVGGRPRQISGEVLDEPAAWSPDGRWIAAADYDGNIELIRPRGSDGHALVHLSGGTSNPLFGQYTVDFRELRWSADGRHLSFRAAKVPPET